LKSQGPDVPTENRIFVLNRFDQFESKLHKKTTILNCEINGFSKVFLLLSDGKANAENMKELAIAFLNHKP
jgi:hypothetical protein